MQTQHIKQRDDIAQALNTLRALREELPARIAGAEARALIETWQAHVEDCEEALEPFEEKEREQIWTLFLGC